ncbi:DUF5659 domain-containing protein [Peribacillus butanolivorans]|uniref:DUF5659 domain-containing protein n=1 Tax=Peribacillus butanolivorans TaxID=421767 RepID=UPI0035DF555D
MKDYLVYNLLLANHLLNEGFRIKAIHKHKHYENKLVFFFENDSKIIEAINKYKNTIGA